MSPVCACVGMNRFLLYVGGKAGRAQRDKLQLPVSTNIVFFGYFLKSLLSVTLQLLCNRDLKGMEGVNPVTTFDHLDRRVSLLVDVKTLADLRPAIGKRLL